MTEMISMFILGFIFAGCLMGFVVVNILFDEDDAEDEHLDEMAKWYEEEYPNDEIR